jgi:hypothetical protein
MEEARKLKRLGIIPKSNHTVEFTGLATTNSKDPDFKKTEEYSEMISHYQTIKHLPPPVKDETPFPNDSSSDNLTKPL